MANQTRAPTSDQSASGTWTGSAGTRYQAVDDYPDTSGADVLTHGTTSGAIQFGFSAFSVPSTAVISSVSVQYYDSKNAAQSCNIGARITVNGTAYSASTHNPSNGTITAREDVWATNPDTGAAWTVADVNGTGSNPLQYFGVQSTDANPTINLTSIQLVVTYTNNYTLTAAGGSFSLAGQTSALKVSRKLLADGGSFSLAGQNATLTYTPSGPTYTLTSDAGSFVLSGVASGLQSGRVLLAESGSLLLNGQASALQASRSLLAAVGAFTVSGQDATITYTPASGPTYTLTANAGSFAITGQSAGTIASRILPAGAGSFAEAGQPAGLFGARILAASGGSFSLSGQSSNFSVGRRVAADAGSYNIIGQNAALTYTPVGGTYSLTAEPGSFTLTGVVAPLSAGRGLIAGTGTFALTGGPASVKFTAKAPRARRRVPEFIPDDRVHRAEIARILNEAVSGRLDCTKEVTLTASAATTTVTDARINIWTAALYVPTTANAAAEIAAGGMYVTVANGSLTINHANNAQTDRNFVFAFIG